MTEAVLRRRFIDVNGRRVHLLRLGSGPPALLVHSSPTNAWYVLPQMQRLAARYTCFAFDTPGFGLSEALPGDKLQVSDLAQALADNMHAIGLPACPVFGTHSGAAIALSLGVHHPERVTALVLDGLPVFTDEEQADLFSGYFAALQIDEGGGHYARTWTRFRDQYAWFPWTHKRPERHNEIDLGSTAAIHDWTMNFFHAAQGYRPAYHAVCHYGQQGLRDAGALHCPVVYTAVESDMLYPHLERLPLLRSDQSVRRVGLDKSAIDILIDESFARWPAQEPAPADACALTAADGIGQQFIDIGQGQVLLRHAGAARQPCVLLLHDAPGTGARIEPLMLELGRHLRVLAPDLPGCGGSTALPEGTALAAYADAVADTLAVMRQGVADAPVCVYGIGIGATLALLLAERHPQSVASVVLRGLALPDPAQRAELEQRYAPPITLQADGSHWYRTWLMLRDELVWFPWYDARAVRLRRVPGDFDAELLHERTFEVMKQHASYHRVIHAALAFDAAASLARLRQPLALCHDPQVPFFAFDAALRAACPGAVTLPTAAPTQATGLLAFIQAARSPAPATRLPETSP